MLSNNEENISEQMEKLVTIAERGGIVANTLKNAVDLKMTIS